MSENSSNKRTSQHTSESPQELWYSFYDENIATLLHLSKKYGLFCIQNSPAFDLKADRPLWHFRSRDSKPKIFI